MDINNIITFLSITETGSFIVAAEAVHVSQSTVSMRIQALEYELGVKLFTRNKNGAVLTPAGEDFKTHALAITLNWSQAKFQLGRKEGNETLIRCGSQLSLWGNFLTDWLAWMKTTSPSITINAEIGYIDALMAGLLRRTLDLAVMYRPQQRAGLEIKKLFDDEIILVSSPNALDPKFGKDYMFINWGPEFQSDHSLNFPNLKNPNLSLDLSVLGIDVLLKANASGYFPRRTVAKFLEKKELIEIKDVPIFSYPVFSVYRHDLPKTIIRKVNEGMKAIIGSYKQEGHI